MNVLIIFLLSSSSVCFAGVGGFGGGVNNIEEPTKYITETVCDGGESGTLCRTITYKVRPLNPQPQEPLCLIGEASQVGPCPKEMAEKIPNLFEILNGFLFKKNNGTP